MRILSLAASLIAGCLLSTGPALAQPLQPDLAKQRAAIERLAPLVGSWRGIGNVLGEHPLTVHQTERVERDLGGLALVIHGTGYADAAHSGKPIFEAMAVISFDDRRDVYEVRSYARGYATTATAGFLDDGAFRWNIDAGPAKMRYTIRIDKDTWSETGEMSRDGGTTWAPTMEMSLSRAD